MTATPDVVASTLAQKLVARASGRASVLSLIHI